MGTKSSKKKKKTAKNIEKEDIRVIQNNNFGTGSDWQFQREEPENRLEELKVVNSYDNNNDRYNSNRATNSYYNGGYVAEQDFNDAEKAQNKVRCTKECLFSVYTLLF